MYNFSLILFLNVYYKRKVLLRKSNKVTGGSIKLHFPYPVIGLFFYLSFKEGINAGSVVRTQMKEV